MSPSLLTAFPTESLASDLSLYRSDQGVFPPDTQLAAGPTDLVSAVNSSMWVWTKNGVVRGSVDLNTFFPLPIGYSFTDPRVVYDAPTSRWFVSGLAFDSSNDSQVYVATSQTSDPTGLYSVYLISSETGVVQDQPKLGLDSAVVALSWNDFTGGTSFSGQETKVIEKADLLTGRSTVRLSSFPADTTRFDIVPVQSLAATSTEFMVYNDSCGTHTTGSCTTGTSALGRVAITGTPAAGNVAWSESDPAITATTNPPPADQPGHTASVQTNDDRFLTAISDSSTIYLSGNDGCVPAGDLVARPCARIIEVTVGATPAVTLDSVLGYSGGDLYFPAVAPDVGGNIFVAATFSSTSTYPQAAGLALAAGASSYSFVAYQVGSGAYTDGRWGDYSGVAVDPSNPKDIWVAAEYAPTNGTNWGTAIGELTLPPPPPPPPFAPHNVGAPQVAVTPDGSQQLVFWKDTTTNQLAEAWYALGSWHGPVGFGQLGALTSTPGVAVTKDGSQQLVFWQGPGGHLFEAWYTLGSWHGPLDITNAYLGGHGILASAPSVVTTTDGSQLVFWRGTDGHLAEAWYAAGGWHSSSDTTAGTLASAPSAAVTADGSQQLVFWQGTDNHLTQVWYALGSWHGPQDWTNLGSISSQPSVTVTPDGTQQLVFYKTAAGHLMESWYTNQWNGPVDWTNASFGGQGLLSSSPSATVTVDGSQQLVFWQGAANTLWEAWYAGGGWNGPRNWSG